MLGFAGTLMDKLGKSLFLECLQHACVHRPTAEPESKTVVLAWAPRSAVVEPRSSGSVITYLLLYALLVYGSSIVWQLKW